MEAAPDQPQLGEAIRSRRQAAALTLSELARRADLDTITLWRIETGRTSPLAKTVKKIADALGADDEELTQA